MPSSIDRIWHIAYFLMNEHSFKVVEVTTKDPCYKSSVYDDIIDQVDYIIEWIKQIFGDIWIIYSRVYHNPTRKWNKCLKTWILLFEMSDMGFNW